MTGDKMIFWLDELCREHSALVGKKCANIGELMKAGFRVPQGFALALTAYEEFLETTGVRDKIRRHFAQFDADPDNPEDLLRYVEAGKVIRGMVESEPMPRHIADNVLDYYDELCRKTGIKDVAVSTRSAGPASHPGQYETYLGVAGKSEVINHIIKVWSSTYNTRSLIARARKGLPLEYDPIGVGVCKMVNAKAAGVMFTADPNTADSNRI
ncbi:MAG: PEP/pyruvate-binding domain-containing protein, partial [Deltaproteobacteria bacterium]|nr:PEP/pyruvate-binding domain-containing protein [Deltaproteobacteria bacterium]